MNSFRDKSTFVYSIFALFETHEICSLPLFFSVPILGVVCVSLFVNFVYLFGYVAVCFITSVLLNDVAKFTDNSENLFGFLAVIE